jgi:hypothetical protein
MLAHDESADSGGDSGSLGQSRDDIGTGRCLAGSMARKCDQQHRSIKASLHGGLAGEREAADDGHVAGPKDCGFGKPHALTVALESARDADALGVFAAEALGRGR